MKILLVNPTKSFHLAIEEELKYPHFHITSLHAKSNFENNIRIIHPDVIILFENDNNIPSLLETIEFIRSKKGFETTQIIYLIEAMKDERLIDLYEKGVDFILLNSTSYLVIFKYLQNIKAKSTNQNITENHFITLNSNNYSVNIENKTIYLVKREFELLQFLLTPPNKICSRTDIMQHIWSDMQLKNDRTIDVHVTRLRKKLNIENIVTIKRKGFKFILK